MSLEIDQWEVEFRPWGWLRLRELSGAGPSVYLRYQLAAASQGQERLELRDAVIRTSGGEALSARVWRRIPFTPLEKTLTRILITLPRATRPETNPPPAVQRAAEALLAARREFTEGVSGFTPPSLSHLDEFFDATEEATIIQSSRFPGGMLVDDTEPKARLPRIQPPKGRLTDEFLQDVAEAYRWATGSQKAPAPTIAEVAETDVSVRTVHRWIYEARKRGILPPARSGRAG